MPHYYHVPRCCGIYYVPHTTVIVHSPPFQPSWLPQVSLSVNSTIRDTSSSTVLTQTFVNPLKRDAIEKAKYNFPLYESCAVVSFRCFVGKRLIQGVVKEKEDAKFEYNAAVSRGETAGLLEMHTPDVFSTSLGNIPAGETVKVEVEYIMELKHDAEVDGLRFTIPTSIAPRYGSAPSGLYTLSSQPTADGMKISVKLTMPSNVRSVQSPSHTISMHLGGHVEDVADDAFNPKHALATLSQKSTELGADFILLVKCADLSSPRALLETHSTIPNSKALMLTLVPKFTLPSDSKPEIVFIVDRSGSMSNRMKPLKSALAVFLKSLPIGVKFNICSFGTNHSFLWKKSQSYSADTLDKAQKHVESMQANFGGTEILGPIKATVSGRYKDIPLEIMVLTDGEVWNTDELFKFIEKETASGDVRVFSLGIGRDVSHALVEGMSRIGGGFAQIVSDEKEGLEGKVVRMLRGGLSAHIKDYRLEWDGRPAEEDVKDKGKNPVFAAVKKKINLFDTSADSDPPISAATSGVKRFAHLPTFIVPTVIQAPYKIPTLFPFSRSTVYAILTGENVPATKSVWLRGTTPSGDELELEIAVQPIQGTSRTIHQLAARKILQELEEGTSYLHSGKYGVDKKKNEGTFSDWVDREGTRVGVRFGVASKWTSFVAVEKKEKEKEGKSVGKPEKVSEEKDGFVDVESVTEIGDSDDLLDFVDDEAFEMEASEASEGGSPSGFLDARRQVEYRLARELASLPQQQARTKESLTEGGSSSGFLDIEADADSDDQDDQATRCSQTFSRGFTKAALRKRTAEKSTSVMASLDSKPLLMQNRSMDVHYELSADSFGGEEYGYSQEEYSVKRKPAAPIGGGFPPGMAPALEMSAPVSGAKGSRSFFSRGRMSAPAAAAPAPVPQPQKSNPKYLTSFFSKNRSTVARAAPAPAITSPPPALASLPSLLRDRTRTLIAEQAFEGYFCLTVTFAGALNLSLPFLEAKLNELSIPLTEDWRRLFATMLAVGVFEGKLNGEKDMWELVVEKAKGWIAGVQGEQAGAEKLKGLVGDVLTGLRF